VRPTTDAAAAAAAGDGDGREEAVKMISDSQVYVLNAGEAVVLECYFVAAKYNMFDYPLLWKKVRQLHALYFVTFHFLKLFT